MDSKTQKNLVEAKALFYSWRLVDAYHIFRRYFDRLPFKPEPEHAEYIGFFTRILLELGKEYELKFYMAELERLRETVKDATISFQLGIIYALLPEPKWEAAKSIFEEILRDGKASEFHARSKMMLAHYYIDRNDIASCRALIDSIPPQKDGNLRILSEIWKATVLRREKKFDAAHELLEVILKDLNPQKNWYAYFSARLIQTMTFVDQERLGEAKKNVEEIKALFAGRYFKTIQFQYECLEKLIESKSACDIVHFTEGETRSILTYDNKSLSLKSQSPMQKLLLLLIKKKYIDKEYIVKNLYSRDYDAERDDKLIYYHIHSLRKRLTSIGLPSDALRIDGDGYRFIPRVEKSEILTGGKIEIR